MEMFPESETKFFMTHTNAQLSFNLNAQGYAESVVLHTNGQEHLAKRVDESVVAAYEATLQKYIADNRPTPEREVMLRRTLASYYAGVPNYEDLAPLQIELHKRVWQTVRRNARRLGKPTKLEFLRVKDNGWDVYKAFFENGELMCEIGPLTPDHKIESLWMESP